MTNIPIYRAKWLYKDNITSEEYISGYVTGFYFEYLEKHCIRTNNSEPFAVEIDSTTLEVSVNSKDWFTMGELENILNSNEKIKRRESAEKGHNYDETYFR